MPVGYKLVEVKDRSNGLAYLWSWSMLFEDKANKLKNHIDAKDIVLHRFRSVHMELLPLSK